MTMLKMNDVESLLPRQRRQAIEAGLDRLETIFFGRSFPASKRTAEDADPELPEVLHALPECIRRKLPFGSVPPGETKERLYHGFHASVVVLERMHERCQEFLKQVFKVNVLRREDWMHEKEK